MIGAEIGDTIYKHLTRSTVSRVGIRVKLVGYLVSVNCEVYFVLVSVKFTFYLITNYSNQIL